MHILAVDIGNSHIVLGFKKDDGTMHVFRLYTDRNKTADQYTAEINSIFEFNNFDKNEFEGAIVSSVVPQVTSAIHEAVFAVIGKRAINVGAGIKTGLDIRIEGASELGADAVCVSVAALKKYGAPCAIIDLGTATKILVLDKDGSYIGGAIAPGTTIAANALTERASLLPNISIEQPKRAICGATTEAIKSGVVFGSAAMIDGMLDRFEEELGYALTAVATGGIAHKIIPSCKRKITLDENLILDGLIILYKKNK